MFDKLPHTIGGNAGQHRRPDLAHPRPDRPQSRSAPGVHLHWELPELLQAGPPRPRHRPDPRSRRPPTGGWSAGRCGSGTRPAKAYGAAPATELGRGERLPHRPAADPTPTASLGCRSPSRCTAPGSKAPYLYMGRVVDAAGWDPNATPASSYLPAYTGADQQPLYLTSIGFTGAAFSGYYPDCRSGLRVLGLLRGRHRRVPRDHRSAGIQFARLVRRHRLAAERRRRPAELVQRAGEPRRTTPTSDSAPSEKVPVARRPPRCPASWPSRISAGSFTDDAVSFTLNDRRDAGQRSTAPDSTLCAGTPGRCRVDRSGTLSSVRRRRPTTGRTRSQIAAGNTTAEAVAALVASQLPAPAGGDDPVVLDDYETLLEALQLGLLRDLEPRRQRAGRARQGPARQGRSPRSTAVTSGPSQSTAAPGRAQLGRGRPCR